MVGAYTGGGTVDKAIDNFLLAGSGPLRFEDFPSVPTARQQRVSLAPR